MASELMEIAREVRAVKGDHVCEHCSKAFTKETSMLAHLCEPKRRMQQKSEMGVQIGLQAWLRFYELSQGSAKLKTYNDFAKSTYYKAFVKFGRYCHSMEVIAVGKFIDYVIKKNIKLDHWTKEQHYQQYLFELIRMEASQDGVERSILTMEKWGESNNDDFNNYFKNVSGNQFATHVINGRISPWAVYCSDSGCELIGKLNEDALSLVWQWIDPDFWQRRLKDYPADTEMTKYILQTAGM